MKTTITSLIISLVILFSFVGGIYFEKSRSHSTFEITMMNDDIIKEKNNKIDSLLSIIEEYEKINSCLRDSVREIAIVRTVEVDAVKKLPLTDGVKFLKQKLGEYEEE